MKNAALSERSKLLRSHLWRCPRLMNRWAFSPQTARIADTLQSVPTGCVYFVVCQLIVGTKCISSAHARIKTNFSLKGKLISSLGQRPRLLIRWAFSPQRHVLRTLCRVSLQVMCIFYCVSIVCRDEMYFVRREW